MGIFVASITSECTRNRGEPVYFETGLGPSAALSKAGLTLETAVLHRAD